MQTSVTYNYSLDRTCNSYKGKPTTPFGVDSTVFIMASADRIREQYDTQLREPGYRRLTSTTKIVGTWDDHDYGINDGDARYPYRDMSQELLLDFLDEPLESPRRKQAGVYTSHELEVIHMCESLCATVPLSKH